MKKQCRIMTTERTKPFKNLQIIVLLVLSALLYTGCYTATLAPTEDNLHSKQLTPSPGKALVYFYLDRGEYSLIDVAVSLNGFKSRISENTYVLWEVFPGEYLLTFDDGQLEIQCEADQIYYYHIASKSFVTEKLGQASDATGRAKINEFSLVKWFKDIPAPPKAKASSEAEVAADVVEPTERVKTKVPIQDSSDQRIDFVSTEYVPSKEQSESTTIVTPVRPTSTPIPFAIRDPQFEAKHKDECTTDATIISVDGDSFRVEAGSQLTFLDGTLALWCHSAKHTWKDRLTYAGHVFDSDSESPLQFMVDKDKGYVYLGGKGIVTLPDGNVISLPVEHSGKSVGTPGSIPDAPVESKRDIIPTAQQAGDPHTDSDTVDTEELKSAKNETGQLLISNPRVHSTISAVNVTLNYKWKQEMKDVSRLRLSVVITGGGLAPGASYKRWLSPLHGRILEDASECKYDPHNPEHFHFCMQKTVMHFTLVKMGIWAVPGLSGSGQLVVRMMDEESKEALSNVLTINATFSESKESAKSDVNTLILDRKDVDANKPHPPTEIIGTIRLIVQKDSDVTVTTFKDGIMTANQAQFEYEPDADIKASLEQMEFEVIPEDSKRPGDATLVVRYEEKKRGSGLDSPTAYYFSFRLSHMTKGTLLEGSTKATGYDSAEELRNDPQFRDIGVLVKKAFDQEILDHQEAQQRRVITQQQLALKGLTAKTIHEILTLPEDEIDLATAILLISKEAFDDLYHIDVDVAKYRHRIDDMAEALSKKIGAAKKPEDIIEAVNRYVFKDLNFSYISSKKDPKAIFLNFALDENKADCLGLSTLYLSLAERIGLPLYGVSPPYHFFVRYEEDATSINIETTDNGKSPSDDFYRERFNVPEGNEFYLKSLGKRETMSTFLGNVGNIYLEKGRPDGAISLYKKALTIIPRHVEVHSRLGVAYAEKGMLPEAISEQKKALAIEPQSDIALGNLGEIYVRMDKLDEAVLECKKAIAINPKNAQAHNSLGNCYMAKDLFAQSISEFRTALSIEPDNAIMHGNLGLAYSHKGMPDEAISEYKKALAINSNYAPAHYGLAVEYYYKKQHALAIKHCDRAIELGYKVKPVILELLKPYR